VGAASLPLARLSNQITKRDERNKKFERRHFWAGFVHRSISAVSSIPSMRCRYDEDTGGEQRCNWGLLTMVNKSSFDYSASMQRERSFFQEK
jgi:hypothetical protein